MKSVLAFICCLLASGTTLAQNLVPNPGFEDYEHCPDQLSAIIGVFNPTQPLTLKNWVNPSMGTPDYYNSCTDNATIDVPNNFRGYHPAYLGEAYAGILIQYTKSADYFHYEYIQVKLAEPLVMDRDYDISCFVRQASSSNIVVNIGQYALDELQAVFSNTKIVNNATSKMTITNVVVMKEKQGGFITDNLGWVEIKGQYRASGGEEWLTIGRFDVAQPAHKLVYPTTPANFSTDQSYYMIDEVSVVGHNCDTFKTNKDTLLCSSQPFSITFSSSAPADSSKYLWNTSDNSAKLIVTQTGKYWCKTIRNCHVYYDTFTVRVFDSLHSSRNVTVCSAGKFIVCPTGAPPYRWNTDDTTQEIFVQQPGRYWCRSFVDCKMMIDTFIVLARDTSVYRTDTALCGRQLQLSSPHTGNEFYWSTGGTAPGITVSQPGIFWRLASGECDVYIDSFFVMPGAIVQPLGDTTMCRAEPFAIGTQYDSAVTVRFKWNTGDTVCCITPSATGLYSVLVQSPGCPDVHDALSVTFKDCEQCISIPDAFTPNGDSRNDYFRPIISCTVAEFNIRVFNRWGQAVYAAENNIQGWNGMHGASLADVGTYFYYIEYITPSKQKKTLKGDVLLIR